ncbi:MAG: dihydroorotate dehydrogenase electron transfer subunit [Myxococcota bacterium]|nr:dihydroorotate dehydrogenase electron transfer subunit [Myxococcota bacterium]
MPPAQIPVPIRALAAVIANDDEGGGNRRLALRVPAWPGFAPGQFAMLSPGACAEVPRSDPLLPRPMAVYRARVLDGGEGAARVEVLYKVTGRGTALLADALPGQSVAWVGPLGQGFPAPARGERALLVAGGTGIASVFELARTLEEAGRPVCVLLGARTAGDLMGVEDFEALGVELRIATEDGSRGARGLVTALLEQALDEGGPARVYACGPTPMMQRCAELAAARGTPCLASLENHMACGFGVCLGCAAPRSEGGFSLVCRDGPMFDAASIAWERMP